MAAHTTLWLRWLALALLLGAAPGALANELYRDTELTWEMGVGLGAVAGPDYRGSRKSRNYFSLVPYLTYRGNFLRSDSEGIRGDFFRSDQVELTLSASATVTPDSHKNQAREGMTPLDSSVELGPAINVNLTGEDFSRGLFLHFPVRAVISVGRRSPEYVGLIGQAQLAYRFDLAGWNATYRGGLLFGSRRHHDYYYTVPADNARPGRPAYRASAGYSGFGQQLAMSKAVGDFRLGWYLRYDNLAGAAFNDSPLVETRHSVSGGFALVWIFADSTAEPIF